MLKLKCTFWTSPCLHWLYFVCISLFFIKYRSTWIKWWIHWVLTHCKAQRVFRDMVRVCSLLVISAFQRECCVHTSLQTLFWQYWRTASVAVKLPSLTSPPAIINHVTHGMKSSGSAAISGHPCIYMTIQRDLPASRCVSQSLCLCLYDFIA